MDVCASPCDPGAATLKNMLSVADRLTFIQTLKLPREMLAGIGQSWIDRISQLRAGVAALCARQFPEQCDESDGPKTQKLDATMPMTANNAANIDQYSMFTAINECLPANRCRQPVGCGRPASMALKAARLFSHLPRTQFMAAAIKIPKPMPQSKLCPWIVPAVPPKRGDKRAARTNPAKSPNMPIKNVKNPKPRQTTTNISTSPLSRSYCVIDRRAWYSTVIASFFRRGEECDDLFS